MESSSESSGKNLVLAVLAFLGQKYIACGDKMVFSEVFGLFLPIYWCCMIKFCYMNIIYCLQMKK